MWPATNKRWRDVTWREWCFMAAVFVCGLAGMALALLVLGTFSRGGV